MLTLNLNSEKNVSPWQRASCIAGSSRPPRSFPDHAAVLAGDDRWTYGELDRAANALARHLAARGIGRGDRVAVMTSNRPEFVVAVHAASKVGAAPVMLNSVLEGARGRHGASA